MELLLNLVWLALALLAFTAFVRGRKASARHPRASYRTALLALACVVVLLFPVVSASDDLHPTQAVLEDASKRVQKMAAPHHHESFSSSPSVVSAVLALYFLAALVSLATWRPVVPKVCVISLSHKTISGRAPPIL
jgi:hypothetical protein